MSEVSSTVLGAESQLAREWPGMLIGRYRLDVAKVGVKVFEDMRTEKPGERPDENEYRQRVSDELRGFIPAWVLMLVAQFLIGKLLEWLWDEWVESVDS